ncbi:MAG: ParB/RepB/Spo0J family partition protein [Cyanobacteria bacterium J06650_10]
MSSAAKKKMSVGSNWLGELVTTPSGLAASSTDESISEIAIAKIWKPKQQRIYFDRAEVEKLKAAIKDEGFRGAVLVTPLSDDHSARTEGFEYELVFGANRVMACEELGNDQIRAEIKKLDPKQVRRIRFDENMVRKNLNHFEVLLGYLELMADEAGTTTEVVEQELNQMSNSAKRGGDLSGDVSSHIKLYQAILDRYNGGKLTTFRSKLIRFRSLPTDVRTALDAGKVDASKALELGSVKNADERTDLLDWVISDNPPVADIRKEKRQRIERAPEKEGKKLTANMKKASSAVTELTSLLKGDSLKTKNKEASELLSQINELIAHLQKLV